MPSEDDHRVGKYTGAKGSRSLPLRPTDDRTLDPRLLRIYWLLAYYVDGQNLRFVESRSSEIGWELGARSLWCYIGVGNVIYLEDSSEGLAIHPNRRTIRRKILLFLGPPCHLKASPGTSGTGKP